MKNNRKLFIIILLLCCVALGGGVFFTYRLVKYEKTQNSKISQLQDDISLLREEFKALKGEKTIDYSDTAYNYLAIGNSITKHDVCDYWWNEIGMAASSEDNDYVHLVIGKLVEKYGDVYSYAYNFYLWEAQAADRAETLELLDPYMDSRLNLVTIQLSENVSNMDTFEEDFTKLINYIREKSPEAQIIIIDDFWNSRDKSTIKARVAQKFNIAFVNLSEIKGNADYQCGLGTIVYDDEGNPHIVEHDGVAIHPGDLGMEYIANAIIDLIN